MNKHVNADAAGVRFVASDEQAALPLPRFVTRTTLRELLDGEPLAPDAPPVAPAPPPTAA